MASGFEGAPLSRLLFMSTTLQSFMLPRSVKRDLTFDLGRILAHGEVWRVFSQQFAFMEYGEALNGIIHIYWFRVLERMLGSRRFGFFLAIAWTASISLATGALVLLGDRYEDGAAYIRMKPGPYMLIFSMYSLYNSLIPPTRPRLAGIFGIHFSEKSFVYLVGTQLLFSAGLSSFIPGLCGLLAGSAYLSDTLKLYTLALPKWCDRLLHPRRRNNPLSTPSDTTETPTNTRRSNLTFATSQEGHRMPGATDIQDDDRRDIDAAMTAHAMAAAQPSPNNIESLVAMGFERETSIEALRATGDNLEHAANRLLSTLG